MRFLLDQSADARMIAYLQEQGHDVTRIARDYPPGLPDGEVLAIAYRERRVLIANDHDFGELVFVKFQPHAGVILFRLGNDLPVEAINARLAEVLRQHAHKLDQFLVVTFHAIRVSRQMDGQSILE